MSCLAAGFSTGVTSFSLMESAVLIAERSSELGLLSHILYRRGKRGMRVLGQAGRLRRVVSTWCGGDQTLTEPGPAGQSLRVSHSRLQRHAAATGPSHLPSCQLEGEGGVISWRVREDSFEVESIDIFWCSLSLSAGLW